LRLGAAADGEGTAIGQRSILADSIEDWLEVILKSGNF
jgi:hypothetical protein